MQNDLITEQKAYKYDAFISYRHVVPDKIIAERLHKLLETYRVPANLVKNGALRKLNRVFLDRSELPTDSSLSESIEKNLIASRFLIVVCSPRTQESKWVMKEIETFIKLGRANRILTVLVEGEPDTSFPPMLRFKPYINDEGIEDLQEIEPLAADVRADSLRGSLRKLSIEKLRVLAPIIGCGFDDLWQRHIRRQRQQRILYGACSVMLLAVMGGYGWWTQEQKAMEKDRLTVAAEVMGDIASMDNRLTYVNQAMDLESQDDKFTAQMAQIRSRVAPALNPTVDIRYQQVLLNQRVSSLRQSINSSPLRTDYGDILGKAVLHTGVDQQEIRSFFDYLKNVDDTTTSLLDDMTSMSTQNPDDQALYKYRKDKVDLHLATLNNRSELAYVHGLIILSDLRDNLPPEYADRIHGLNNLTPKSIIDRKGAVSEEKRLVEEAAYLVREKAKLVKTAQDLTSDKIEEYQQVINQKLTINPNDTYEVVAGKAKSLRQLGRIDDSIGAYKKYGEMFAATDPTASLYAQTGCLFAAQADKLGFDGGAYIFQVKPGSAADIAGIKPGDIIVAYDQNMVSDPDILVKAIKAKSLGTAAQVKILRKNQDNLLESVQLQVAAGTMGVGLMNI